MRRCWSTCRSCWIRRCSWIEIWAALITGTSPQPSPIRWERESRRTPSVDSDALRSELAQSFSKNRLQPFSNRTPKWNLERPLPSGRVPASRLNFQHTHQNFGGGGNFVDEIFGGTPKITRRRRVLPKTYSRVWLPFRSSGLTGPSPQPSPIRGERESRRTPSVDSDALKSELAQSFSKNRLQPFSNQPAFTRQ